MPILFDQEFWEIAGNMVTVVGLPFAIAVFVWEQRRQRQSEQEELYQRLSDEYTGFLKLVMQNADLRLLIARDQAPTLNPEQMERQNVLFNILVAIFERAYLLVYEEKMSLQTRRLWQSWEDYMREWCRRADFQSLLPELLRGEDVAFADHIRRIVRDENASLRAAQTL